jgi:hypothetical protein
MRGRTKEDYKVLGQDTLPETLVRHQTAEDNNVYYCHNLSSDLENCYVIGEVTVFIPKAFKNCFSFCFCSSSLYLAKSAKLRPPHFQASVATTSPCSVMKLDHLKGSSLSLKLSGRP